MKAQISPVPPIRKPAEPGPRPPRKPVPKKPKNAYINFRVETRFRERLLALAKLDGRTISSMAIWIFQAGFKEVERIVRARAGSKK